MSTQSKPPDLILASGSTTRQTMLRQAGLEITVRPAQLDEAPIKAKLQASGVTAPNLAAALAMAKAQAVAAVHPAAWVIGADQVLTCDGEWFDKAPDMAAARKTLQRLRGRPHQLHAAVCVRRQGMPPWQHTSSAELWMRPLSEDDIAGYLDRAGSSVLWSVGCYQIEGLGVQLFERIEGDHFTILGLPLIPLLQYLRTAGLVTR